MPAWEFETSGILEHSIVDLGFGTAPRNRSHPIASLSARCPTCRHLKDVLETTHISMLVDVLLQTVCTKKYYGNNAMQKRVQFNSLHTLHSPCNRSAGFCRSVAFSCTSFYFAGGSYKRLGNLTQGGAESLGVF